MRRIVLYTDGRVDRRTSEARELLRDRGIPFMEMHLHEDFTLQGLREIYPEASTFPVAVIDDFHVGGFDELKRYLHENHDKLLLE